MRTSIAVVAQKTQTNSTTFFDVHSHTQSRSTVHPPDRRERESELPSSAPAGPARRRTSAYCVCVWLCAVTRMACVHCSTRLVHGMSLTCAVRSESLFSLSQSVAKIPRSSRLGRTPLSRLLPAPHTRARARSQPPHPRFAHQIH